MKTPRQMDLILTICIAVFIVVTSAQAQQALPIPPLPQVLRLLNSVESGHAYLSACACANVVTVPVVISVILKFGDDALPELYNRPSALKSVSRYSFKDSLSVA